MERRSLVCRFFIPPTESSRKIGVCRPIVGFANFEATAQWLLAMQRGSLEKRRGRIAIDQLPPGVLIYDVVGLCMRADKHEVVGKRAEHVLRALHPEEKDCVLADQP